MERNEGRLGKEWLKNNQGSPTPCKMHLNSNITSAYLSCMILLFYTQSSDNWLLRNGTRMPLPTPLLTDMLAVYVRFMMWCVKCVSLGTGTVDPDGGVDAAEAAADPASHICLPACVSQWRTAMLSSSGGWDANGEPCSRTQPQHTHHPQFRLPK